MPDLVQRARYAIRLLRQRGFTLRVERQEGEEPKLFVTPTKELTDYLRGSIKTCKPEIVKLLEDEAQGHYTDANGTPWLDLARCPQCGYRDIGKRKTLDLASGAKIEVWSCFVCSVTPEETERQLQEAEANIRWATRDKRD